MVSFALPIVFCGLAAILGADAAAHESLRRLGERHHAEAAGGIQPEVAFSMVQLGLTLEGGLRLFQVCLGTDLRRLGLFELQPVGLWFDGE